MTKPRATGAHRSHSPVALAILATFSILVLGLAIAGRPPAGTTPANGGFDASMPYRITLLLAGASLVAAWLAFAAWRGWVASQARLDRLAADATRIALGEYTWRASDHGRPVLEPVASALNRLATLVAATDSVLEDRDRQLETMRNLGDAAYWETSVEGRIVRVEYGASWPPRRWTLRAGQAQFEGAEPLDPMRWVASSRAIAERRAWHGLPLMRANAQGRPVQVLESGVPRFRADGHFVGYCGVSRIAASDAISADDGITARTAAETSAEPTLVIALDQDIVTVRHSNDAAHRLFACKARELLDRALGTLLGGGEEAALEALHEALSGRTPLRRTLAIRNRYGERVEVLARLEPVPQHPALAVLVLDARAAELAALRRHSGDVSQLRLRLAAQAQRIERLERESEVFASGVSHDLRAPLRAVDGFAKLIHEHHEGQLDDVGRDYLDRILTGCARMDRMIDAVLALSRVSRVPLVRAPVDLGRIAREVVDGLRRQDPQREVDVQFGDALHAHGDPALLRVVLENLLGNAWKYTAETTQAWIRLDATHDARGEPVFCVADNGPGFDMNHADRLFGLFQRLHPEQRFPGTGVGLAIVRRIVEGHGGAIWAESEQGHGSRFSFTLRAAVPARDTAPADTAARLPEDEVRYNPVPPGRSSAW
ncbi:MAG: hypothetical protein KJZ98_11405 [Burkholderiaceae bacterium]|nr:hypothetical protein [Burkholderiaceae bacterium]MEB2352489.1 ATP-binding protein [Burkholderiaceae bacterium]